MNSGTETRENEPPNLHAVLRVDRISKTFLGQRALTEVSLDVNRGEVCGLIGHNGSGKSTLIKILSGYHEPDAGSGGIFVDGAAIPTGRPEAARRAGFRFIHQELGLIDSLTVLDNLRLGSHTYQTGALWRIRRTRERRSVQGLLDRFEIDVDPAAKLSNLSAVQHTEIAVARALQQEDEVRLLVLDEPTATLPEASVQRLFRVIRAVVARGISVLYVSHRLEEIPEITTRVSVLRDSRLVASGPTVEFPRSRLVELITGRSVQAADRSKRRGTGAVEGRVTSASEGYLELDELVGGRQLRGMSLCISLGEVVGLAGLAGSGVHEVPECLLGTRPRVSGRVRVAGRDLARLTPRSLIDRGVAVLPASRSLKAIPSLSVRENLTLPYLKPFWTGVRFRHKLESAEARKLIQLYDIRPNDPERKMATLSGGTQQKVCVAKWLRIDPRLLVLDEPTAGIDVGATYEILRLIRGAADRGVGVLICSSDLDELEQVCDRVLVVRRGRVASELIGDQVRRDLIVAECYESEDDDV